MSSQDLSSQDSDTSLRRQAEAIWHAGLQSVRSDQLILNHVSVDDQQLTVADDTIARDSIGRILVVGAGKAGAGMVHGLETALGADWANDKSLDGWVHVPDDCVEPTRHIHLHGARPAGQNIPTARGVSGAKHILSLVSSCEPDDLVIVLISGGGSALLPAPVSPISLEDKRRTTELLSAAGADISELNCVRTALSRIKGGGLSNACRARRMITLVISDVIGDDLHVIASGPTMPRTGIRQQAAAVIRTYADHGIPFPENVVRFLQQSGKHDSVRSVPEWNRHHIIGNHQTAVLGAACRARELGYRVENIPAESPQTLAEEVGRDLIGRANRVRGTRPEKPTCLICGGEPTVILTAPELRGTGGRNQQLVLAATAWLWDRNDDCAELCLLSGGTDGEDGPTDAAGAVLDGRLLSAARQCGQDPATFLQRNDAYRFFQPLNGLFQTGPTHTNVCDLRICLIAPVRSHG